jgi:hypothetical protein
MIKIITRIALIANLVYWIIFSYPLAKLQVGYSIDKFIGLVVIALLSLTPVLYDWQIILLVKNCFPNKDIPRVNESWMKILSIPYWFTFLITVLALIALSTTFHKHLHVIWRPDEIRVFLLLNLSAFLLPLNAYVFFAGTNVRKMIKRNHRSELLDTFGSDKNA